MRGKIALEEAWSIPESLSSYDPTKLAPPGVIGPDLAAALLDVHGTRLTQMDENGIDTMLLSLSSPGPQGVTDPKAAEQLATLANDRLSEEVLKAPGRFAGLASVSMHDPVQAAGELRRCFGARPGAEGEASRGFVGCIVNDYQSTGEDRNGMVFYDGKEYDPFWAVVEELDVPVYLHPREATPAVMEMMWKGREWLAFSALGYAHRVGMHALGIITGGVLDRFPGVRLVLGHMGEHIPYDLYRIDHKLNRARFPNMPMSPTRLVRDYFGSQVFITTSGHFSTPALQCAMTEIGVRSCMFAVDYPYESIPNACVWFDEHVKISGADLVDIGRNNALGVFTRLTGSPHGLRKMGQAECGVGGLRKDSGEVEYGLYNKDWSRRLEMK
jgi:2,3-dihydroxybenzoate decarboxylase